MTDGWFDYSDILRLEPDAAGDISQGFRAPIADPVWFLGRQWQMREHQGEDAATPVRIRIETRHTPIDSGHDVGEELIPFESLVEGEDDDWWTPSRRIRIGADLHSRFPNVKPEGMTLDPSTLPAPYDSLRGEMFDGLVLWKALPHPPADLSAVVPASRAATWRSRRLAYDRDFAAGKGELQVREHRGGEVDWWSADANKKPGARGGVPETVNRLPTRLSYRGAPHPRWWQIESAEADLGAHAPDRTHLATLVLIELAASHSDDWFIVPLHTHAGVIVSVDAVTVTDAFGRAIVLDPPSDWSIFRTTGLSTRELVVFPSATLPLSGEVTDRVQVSVDQGANLAWAVERLTSGRAIVDEEVDLVDEPEPEGAAVVAGGATWFVYRPTRGLRNHWHPYLLGDSKRGRAWTQAEVDPDLLEAGRAQGPLNELINDWPKSRATPVHRIDSDVLSESGAVLERRYRLARTTSAKPILWRQRERLPTVQGATSDLRFDVLDARPEVSPG